MAIVAALGWCGLVGGDLVPSQAPSYLADIGPAPPVSLTDADGRPFDLESLRGKTVLVSFIYTTCTGSCPATTATLVMAQKELQRQGLWGQAVEFVAISLDPAQDTPEVLARYASTYGIDRTRWHFLTGRPEQVDPVLASWDMWARRDARGVLDHPSRIFLVDPRGRIREIYNLETLNTKTLPRDVRAAR
jgi:protein SCO1/2